MNDMKWIFLGGLFGPSDEVFIENNSIGVIQNAADSLQKNLVLGLDGHLRDGVTVVNLPFIGSYPHRFKKLLYPPSCENFGVKSKIIGAGFVNVTAIKYLSRFLSALISLRHVATSQNNVLFVYSVHLPFILAALTLRFFRRRTRICLIVPDLPEFMGGGGLLHGIFKKLETAIFYKLCRKINTFVVLTNAMAERMSVPADKMVVVEGIAPKIADSKRVIDQLSTQCIRSFVYTGTLAARYGIIDLVDAFMSLRNEKTELWICGDGDAKAYITRAAVRDPRIKYFGQVPRDVSVELQKKGSFLVNPRPPDEEFTKYSFPSKIMEYMATGRPIIMYKLDGIPEEYDSFYIRPTSVGKDGLRDCLDGALRMPAAQSEVLGAMAKDFVLANKSREVQTRRIIELIMRKDEDYEG